MQNLSCPRCELNLGLVVRDAEFQGGVDEAQVAPLKDPVRCVEKAAEDLSGRFAADVLAEACLSDVLRARVGCPEPPSRRVLLRRR